MSTRIRFRPVTSTPEQLIDTKDDWYLLKIKKESSGQAVIGENQELLPVDSGRGIGIAADTWTDMILSPGTILYVAAPTNETIATVEQILPIRQILAALVSLAQPGTLIGPGVGPGASLTDRKRNCG